jgi:hypothetical protein
LVKQGEFQIHFLIILYLSILLHLKNSLIIKQLTFVLRATNLLFLFCSLVTYTQHVSAIVSHHQVYLFFCGFCHTALVVDFILLWLKRSLFCSILRNLTLKIC